MELKLNVYKTRKLKEVEKTLVTDDFKLSTGICEDMLNIINIDIFEGVNALSEEDQILEVMKMVVGGFGVFKELLKETFDDLTDDEIERTDIREIAVVVVRVVKFSLAGLFSAFGGKRKN